MAKVLSWNARGLCNLDAQGSVKWLLNKSKADIVMLQETKIKEKAVVDNAFFPVGWKWEFVPSLGLFGGMLMAWNPNVIDMKASLLETSLQRFEEDYPMLSYGAFGDHETEPNVWLEISHDKAMVNVWCCCKSGLMTGQWGVRSGSTFSS
ncbi:hypothetical protein FRX31_003929 [Thalictrum thalictroides]|uniref:Endonuclease/exonuclease/phosphatase domain-containing protein n=1 Tax=Thalictrum thalictroides TaxID=46969 RepID=A0A7J6X9M2_THATH|nr:hypothetical protein FRX31_003929 [Thalictrum thalictroides]